MGLAFELVLLGERYQRIPQTFNWALERFKNYIIHCGFEENKLHYREWLQRGSSVVSTARQENFGISVVEAIRFGCLPLLPNRLVYPEMIPEEFHTRILYDSQQDLVEKLVAELRIKKRQDENLRNRLSAAMAPFAWERRIGVYDKELEELVKTQPNR